MLYHVISVNLFVYLYYLFINALFFVVVVVVVVRVRFSLKIFFCGNC